MSSLRGSLQSIALTDVVQLLHVNRKTGKLYVIDGKKTGTLFFINGDVIHAETPQAIGDSAAFDVLEWEKGEFEFAPSRFKVPASIRRSVPDLLMESARTADSRKRLRSLFPNLRLVPWPTVQGAALSQGLKLFPEDKKILPYLDGYRDFLDIVSASGMNEVAVLQTCLVLQEAKRLKTLEPSVTLSACTLKSGFWRKIDHVEISKVIEAEWQALPPYRDTPIRNVRLIWPDGPAVVPVQFVAGLGNQTIMIPKEFMEPWRLPEGIYVAVRPAP